MKKIIEFVKQSISELKKVSWPLKEDVRASTYIVIVTIIVVSVFLGVVDEIISRIIQGVIK